MRHKELTERCGDDAYLTVHGTAWRQLADPVRLRREWLALLAHGVRQGLLRVHAFAASAPRLDVLAVSADELRGFVAFARRQRGLGAARLVRDVCLRPVRSALEFGCVLRQIDALASPGAGVSEAAAPPVGSALAYRGSARAPRWLWRGRVEALVAGSGYARAVAPADDEVRWFVERRQSEPPDPNDPLPRLEALGFAPSICRAVLERHVRCVGVRRAPWVAPAGILASVERLKAAMPEPWALGADGRCADPWDLLVSGLLRVACGLSVRETCALVGASDAAVRARCARHAELVSTCEPYAQRAGEVLAGALQGLRLGAR